MEFTRSRRAWSKNEDRSLVEYIKAHGEGKWASLPMKAGLERSGKSCRLRWMNYLRPNIKRGKISSDEEQLIIRLHSLLGNRWSLIAGRLPGRTDNEIKNYWNHYIKKKLSVTKAPEKRTESPKSDSGGGNESQLDTEKGRETFCDYNDDDGVGSKQFAFSGLMFADNEKDFKVFEERVANCVCMNPTDIEGYKEDIEIDESVWYCSIEDYHFHTEISWENALLPLW